MNYFKKLKIMAKILTLLFILLTTTISAQKVDHTGIYRWESSAIIKPGESQITRILRIEADGTFTFDRLRPSWGLNKEDHLYGKGTWTAKGKYIYFTTNPEIDLDNKYTLDFTNTKGRWDARKNKLILYESDIFWLRRFAIAKQAN